MKINKLILAGALAASALTSVPAAAVEVVFAQIGLVNSTANFRFARTGTSSNATFYTTSNGTATVAGDTLVNFSLVGAPAPLLVQANLFLSGSTTGDAAVSANYTGGTAFVQNLDTFTFDIKAISAITNYNGSGVNIGIGQTILSGTVQNSAITGNYAGTTGNLTASSMGGATITFTSPLFNFAPGTSYGLQLGLGGVAPGFGSASGRTLNTFRSTVSGTYQSDPAPTFVTPPNQGIPEPATWAMMIVGMGMVGFARRRRSVAVAA